MKKNPQKINPRQSTPSSHLVIGTIFGLISSIGYTAANICLRSVADCDPVWVSCMKTLPTVFLAGPWLLARAAWGNRVFPSMRTLGLLALAGLFGQIAGNISFQWALGVVGIALTVPITLGGMIVMGAILGRTLLGEPITKRTAWSILILIAAVFILSLGAQDAQQSVAQSVGTLSDTTTFLKIAGGVAAGILAGLAYALLSVAIRHGVTRDAPLSTTVFTTGLVGLFSLSALSYFRIGWQGIMTTSSSDMMLMLMAGLCNAIAFLALTKALQMISIVYVNALNATQAAMAAVIGVLWFQEALTGAMLLGVTLSIGGLMMMKKSNSKFSVQQTEIQLKKTASREDELSSEPSGQSVSIEPAVESEG